MSRNSLLDIKRFSGATQEIINATLLKKHGIECFFEKAAEAINFGATRSEILEALKKDVSKSADALTRAQPIIFSIKNGVVTEFDSVFNTVEEVFGSAYNAELNTITLSGVVFDLNAKVTLDKASLYEKILANVFGFDKKEFDATVKAIALYDSETSPLKKVILSPCLDSADAIVKKVAGFDTTFSVFRKSQSYDEKKEFDISFNRTGIDGVIQNASYVDETGIRQFFKSHRLGEVQTLSDLLRGGTLKYVQACEIDGDGDVSKATLVIRQIERLKLNTRTKFALKFRKLGNYKALGLCMPMHDIVAEDVRETSALLHEIAHHIHLHDLFHNNFVNYMIDKLVKRVDLENNGFALSRDAEYYKNRKEVIARALEIATLLAKEVGKFTMEDEDFNLIKSREHYEMGAGIYFDFNSFDDETKEEMLFLYKLFFQTSPDEIFNSEVDNFVKIKTNYSRTEKSDLNSLLRRAEKDSEKERRALYSMVTAENIAKIIERRGEVSLTELATSIFVNISFCGDYDKRMHISLWALRIEEKASIILELLEALEKEIGEREFYTYLSVLRERRITNRFDLINGFRLVDQIKIRREIEKISHDKFNTLDSLQSKINQHPILLFKECDFVNEVTFLQKEALKNTELILALSELNLNNETILKICNPTWEANSDKGHSYLLTGLVPTCIRADRQAMLEFIRIVHPTSLALIVDDSLKNDAEFMSKAIDLGVPFKECGRELLASVEFCKPYVLADNTLSHFLPTHVAKEILSPKKEEPAKPKKAKKEKAKKAPVANDEMNSFERLIKEAEFFDFEHTRTHEVKKAFRLTEKLPSEKFKRFCKYCSVNGIAYYTSFADGFIVLDAEKISATAA